MFLRSIRQSLQIVIITVRYRPQKYVYKLFCQCLQISMEAISFGHGYMEWKKKTLPLFGI